MNHLFIINPVAGKGKSIKFLPEIKKAFKKRNDIYITEFTQKPGHATEIAKRYVNRDKFRVYSVGGDGTLNEVLNGIVNSESSLAVIPGGSGNDFIKSITPDIDGKTILDRTIEGREDFVDIARVNGKYFLNISSIGFDAEVVYNTRKIKKIPVMPGKFAYITGIFATLFKYRNNYLKISIDDRYVETKSLLVAVANGRYYGGGMLPTPEARIDDGLFDICLIEDKSPIDILHFFPKFIKGEHTGIEGVSLIRGKRVSIRCDKNVVINIDGEVEKTREATFEIIPRGIRIVKPKQSV